MTVKVERVGKREMGRIALGQIVLGQCPMTLQGAVRRDSVKCYFRRG